MAKGREEIEVKMGGIKTVLCAKPIRRIAEPVRSFDAGRLWEAEEVPVELNPKDLSCLEFALKAKKAVPGSTITAVSICTGRGLAVLKNLLALGADKLVYLRDDAFGRSDAMTTARALASAIRALQFDIILCGSSSADTGTGAVGTFLAEFLGLPHLRDARSIKLDEPARKVIVEKKARGGIELWEAGLPVLITCLDFAKYKKYITIKEIIEAKKKPVSFIEAESAGLRKENGGESGSSVEVLKLLPRKGLEHLLSGFDEYLPAQERVNLVLFGPQRAGKAGQIHQVGPEEGANLAMDYILKRLNKII